MKRYLSIVLIVLMLLAVCAVGTGYFLMSLHSGQVSAASAALPIVGHVYFLSSEQLSENSSQGINDEVQIDLSHIASPAAQKGYYTWLLGDKSQDETRTLFLGALPVSNGTAHLFYPGDKQHTNLLEITSRFLVTEEDTAVTPITPALDTTTWRYYAEFSQVLPASTMNSANGSSTSSGVNGTSMDITQFSFLDHLRHLLATDPMLDQMELPGGLNNWLYRNMGKILEWTSSTRENWEEAHDSSSIRRQAIRTLAYLDGMSFVQMDLAPNTPLGIDERLARVGLLEMNGPNQSPACYLDSIVFHLNGLLQTTGASPSLRKDASEIIDALSNVRNWLNKVHQDALQLVKMSNAQMNQPGTLTVLNDMIDNANHAYVGQVDPATGEMHGGVIWIHDHIQALAILDVTSYRA